MSSTHSLATAAPAENWGALPDLVLQRIARHMQRVDVLGALAMHLTCRQWHHSLGRIKKPPHWDASRIPLFAYRPRHLAWALECGWVSPGDALLAATRRPGCPEAFFRAMRDELGSARTKEECNLAGLELRLAKTLTSGGRLHTRNEYDRALVAQCAAVRAQNERRAAALHIITDCGDGVRRRRTARERFLFLFVNCRAHGPNAMAGCAISLHSEVCYLEACMRRIHTHPHEYVIVDAVLLTVAMSRLQHHRCWDSDAHFGPLIEFAKELAQIAMEAAYGLLEDHLKRPTWPEDPAATLDDALRTSAPAWSPLDAHLERILRETLVGHRKYLQILIDTFCISTARLRTWSNHLLRTAAHRGLCGAIELLLARGLTADDVRTYDCHALMYACEYSDTDMVRILIGTGLTPKDAATHHYLAFEYALDAALNCDDTELLQLLLTDERTKPGGLEWLMKLKSHILDATMRNNAVCLRMLVDHGGIPEDGRPRMLSDAVRTAVGHRSYDALRYLVEETGANVPRHLSNDVKCILHANNT